MAGSRQEGVLSSSVEMQQMREQQGYRAAPRASSESNTPEQSTSEPFRSNYDEPVEKRVHAHRYLIRRPRALQYTYHSKVITVGEDSDGDHHVANLVGHQEGDIEKQRERLDLFIDLIWVAIITNLTEVFSALYFEEEGKAGEAFLVFILAFAPSWRIWNFLREFLNNYYLGDTLQRLFIFWILILSLFYGNNLAYLPTDLERIKTILIVLYLFISRSFSLMEAVYSLFIPWMRKQQLVMWIASLPALGLWIAAITIERLDDAIGPIVAATFLEYFVPVILSDPRIVSRIIPSDYHKAIDTEHYASRMGNFFLIVVGEGVLLLIRDGPLGIGITRTASLSIWVFLIYFQLTWLYFNRDLSMHFIPAVRKRGWKTAVWNFWHIPLFASFLTFSASVMFMLRQTSEQPDDQKVESEPLSEKEIAHKIHGSIWIATASLGTIMLSITILALLDKSVDPPGTLVINNRYIRLMGRVIYIIVVCIVPLATQINLNLFLGIASLLLLAVTMWEWNASLEKGGRFVEPKGLTGLMKGEGVRKRERESV